MTYLDKLQDIQFKKIDTKSWIKTIFYWITDSGVGTVQRIDKFLNQQIKYPEYRVFELAGKLHSRNPYFTVYNIERYVHQKFSYATDVDNYGIMEYWSTALQTLERKREDCDGLNSLIYVLCRLAGIPASNLYCIIGETEYGKHFWVLFFDARRDRFVALDATFRTKAIEVRNKKAFKVGSGGYSAVNFLFNELGIWKIKEV